MDTKDITTRQFETLVLIKSLEEFIKDNPGYASLNDGVEALMEGQSVDRDKFIEDVCKLTENGYIQSDADSENIALDLLPDIDGITLKGEELLSGIEKEVIKTAEKAGKKFVLVEDLDFKFSLLGGVEIDMNPIETGVNLFKQLGKGLGRLLGR